MRFGYWLRYVICAALLAVPGFASADDTLPSLQRMLALAGWDEAALAEFADDAPPDDAEIAKSLKLLRRMRGFDARSVEKWTEADVPITAISEYPAKYRGRLLRLEGRVTDVVQYELAAEEAARFELPAYVECRVRLDESTSATVLTATFPSAWRGRNSLDESASFTGLFLKRASAEAHDTDLYFVARRIAWHPVAVSGANDSFGYAVLGGLGFDVGLLDHVHNRQPILSREYEAFYQLLATVGRVGTDQLIRAATSDLPNVAEHWKVEFGATTGQRQLLAQVVVNQAGEGRYSVAPLFNDADDQVGNLVMLEGVARRAVRVDVGRSEFGRQSDVLERFGIDHYFELDIFTDDSQNHPVVFCLRELPEGFPIGSELHEPVRMAGFFFKSWLHHVRRSSTSNFTQSQQQLAPLLVAPGIDWRYSEAKSAGPLPGIIGGGMFAVAIVGIWLAAWWFGRSDREFRRRVVARQCVLPDGHSPEGIIVQEN